MTEIEKPQNKNTETFSNLVKRFIFEYLNTVSTFLAVITHNRD
jgi:hypothetical protein